MHVCLKSDFNGMSFVNVNSEHLLSNRASNEPFFALLASSSSSFRIARFIYILYLCRTTATAYVTIVRFASTLFLSYTLTNVDTLTQMYIQTHKHTCLYLCMAFKSTLIIHNVCSFSACQPLCFAYYFI